jgi:steroid delta-isomerase-like uncharacterized protein
MTREDAQRFFQRRFDDWKRRDIEAITLDHAEDCVLESPVAGEVVGRAAIEQVYRGLLASFPDFAIEATDLIVDGDRVVQVATISGTNTGGFMGLPPTGKHFSVPVALIFTLRDGKIVHEKRIWDFTGFLMEIGALKAKPV